MLAKNQNQCAFRSSTTPLTRFFWLLSHVIYLLYGCLLSQAEWWVAELLFLSLNNWGMNLLKNTCSQSSQIYILQKKLRKVFTFQSCKFYMLKLTKTSILPNCQVQNILYDLQFCYLSHGFGRDNTLLLLLSAWDRSRDSTTKKKLVKGHVEDLNC